MRTTYFEGPDTLRQECLPRGPLNLVYRPDLPKAAHACSIAFLIAVAFASLLLTLGIRIGQFLTTPIATTLIILGSLTFGIVAIVLRKPRDVVRAIFASGLIVCGVLTILQVSSLPQVLYRVGFGLALALVCWSADAIAGHHLLWMAAHPRHSRRVQIHWNRVWRYRFRHAKYWMALLPVLALYVAGGFLFPLMVPTAIPLPLQSMTILLMVAGAFVATALWCITRSGHEFPDWRQVSAPFVNWLTYHPHPTAAGVLRIPLPFIHSTSAPARQIAAAFTLFFLTATITSAACYFPISMLFPSQWHAIKENGADCLPRQRSPEETKLTLTGAQRACIQRLPKDQQAAYLVLLSKRAQLAAFRHARHEADVRLLEYVNSSPEAWIPVIFTYVPENCPYVLRSLFLSILLCVITPLLIFASTILIVTTPLVSTAEKELASGFHYKTDWEGFVGSLQAAAAGSVEGESLWIGTHSSADYPVLLHRDILREHAHILGDSGSGKTALALAPMTAQLIRMAGRDCKRPACRRNPHASIVIIDLKGDLALFHGARIEAERAHLPFQWFTNALHCSTHAFNPFLQTHFKRLSLNQRTEILVDALALSHGEGYGRSYFSRINRRVLSRMLHTYGDFVQSFGDLYQLTLQPDVLGNRFKLSQKEREDAGELFAALETLATFQPLNATDNELVQNQIDMSDVVCKPRVVYFYLQSAIESASVREIGKLALYSLLSAAAQRGPADHQVYLFIDEFQQIASENLEIILRQARSMGIAAILANQTISDLETATSNLIPTVQANTRFKQFFASTDLSQQDDLIKASGETIDYVLRWAASIFEGPTQTESVQPRLTRNDLIRTTDDPALSVVHTPRGKGFLQMSGFPFVARCGFHISQDEYEERLHTSWPTAIPGTFTPTTLSFIDPAAPPRKFSARPEPDPQPTLPAQPASSSEGSFTKKFEEIDAQRRANEELQRQRARKPKKRPGHDPRGQRD